jgi:hypothetical protein
VLANATHGGTVTPLSATMIITFYSTMMGILSYQTDARRQQSAFLLNRGISPVTLWFVKQQVWLLRTSFLLITFAILGIFIFLFMKVLDATEAWIHFRQMTDGLIHDSEDFETTVSWLCWCALLGYLSGQLSSLLFRRTILAIGFAVS